MSSILGYFNPYSGKTFFEFFAVFFSRLWMYLNGSIDFKNLVSDEIQIVVLIGVATSCGIVGCFLVLRKMTMLANALSHTILMGIVIAYLVMMALGVQENPEEAMNIQVLLIAALFTGLLTTFFTEFLTKTVNLQEDASIGIVFTTFFAIGIILITLFTRNVHVGTELVMGNVDALHIKDIQGVYWVLLINLLFFFSLFKEFKISTFDPGLSRALGISPTILNYLLMILTSATAIGGFRAVGVLMILAFLVGPPLTARLLTDKLLSMIFLSIFLGILSSMVGIALSRHFLTYYGLGFSTGGLIVCIIVLFYILAIFLAPKQGIFALIKHRKKIKNKLHI